MRGSPGAKAAGADAPGAPEAAGAGGDLTHGLAATDFAALVGWAEDDHAAAYRAFLRYARALSAGSPSLRSAIPPATVLRHLCAAAATANEGLSAAAARAFFEAKFTPYRILPRTGPSGTPAAASAGFLTGYYEPVVEGSLDRSTEFAAPVLARPPGLARFGPGTAPQPYRARAAIEAEAESGGGRPVVWLRDWVEVFFVHVQGSARVTLPDGTTLRLVYDGRNGHAYTSIGQLLAREGHVAAEDLSLASVQAWVRAHGQAAGSAGRALLQRNQSYIFFRSALVESADEGPIGGAGVALTPLRSIAVDRGIWAYGLPFWIDAKLPWQTPEPEPFRRLMIAQDTGSAILGPARADLFFGAGPKAGAGAGGIRHPGACMVLLPREAGPDLGTVGGEAR